MQKANRNISDCFRLLLPVFLIWLGVSCGRDSGDSPDSPLIEEAGFSVSIELTGQTGEMTRGIADEFGTIAENYIDYKDLYVMTFSIEEGQTGLTADSRLLEVMWHPDFSRSNYSGNSTVSSSGDRILLSAQLSSGITEYKDGNDFCIVAVANIKGFNRQFTLSNNKLRDVSKFSDLNNRLKDIAFGSSAPTEWSWYPDNIRSTGVPMFGVKKVSLKGYDSKIFSQWNPYVIQSNGSGSISLLRAFSKVVIGLSDDFDAPGGVDVKFVSGGGINRYSGTFNLIPALERMEGFASTSETGPVSDKNVFSNINNTDSDISVNESEGGTLKFTASADGKYAYLYLPEYKFKEEEGEKPEFTLLLSFGGGAPQEFRFIFKKYNAESEDPGESGGADETISWNYILRNYFYYFKIGVRYWIISVEPTDWGNTIDNEFNFG